MRLSTLVLAACAAASTGARAQQAVVEGPTLPRPEIALQTTNYQPWGDGTWYQLGLPHVLDLTREGFSLGFTGQLVKYGNWGLNWHLDYVYLGRATAQCWCTPIDANYNLQTRSLVSNPSYAAPLANFQGSGNAQGVAITLQPYYQHGNWKYSLEAGLFPYRPAWSEVVSGWEVDPNVAPQTLSVSTPHAWQLGKVVGVGVSYKSVTVSIKHYWLPNRYDDTHSPTIYKGATIVEGKYVF